MVICSQLSRTSKATQNILNHLIYRAMSSELSKLILTWIYRQGEKEPHHDTQIRSENEWVYHRQTRSSYLPVYMLSIWHVSWFQHDNSELREGRDMTATNMECWHLSHHWPSRPHQDHGSGHRWNSPSIPIHYLHCQQLWRYLKMTHQECWSRSFVFLCSRLWPQSLLLHHLPASPLWC